MSLLRSLSPNFRTRPCLCQKSHVSLKFSVKHHGTNFRSITSSKTLYHGFPTKPSIRENIYTFPNLLTISRIAACPFLGWSIYKGDFAMATSILVYAGVTDWVDGYVARKYNMRSVIGTILDPAADKALVTTLTLSLAYKSLLPIPLAVIIIGRDLLLSATAFYYRYISLPPPRTFTRYWDFSIPSAEVKPTVISKINTALQLTLMGLSTISPLLPFSMTMPLSCLQWTVAGTTLWSGLSYVFSKTAVRFLHKP